MINKKLVAQVVAGIVLFTLISVVLEKEYTQAVFLEKFWNGLVFGAIYGVFVWARNKFKSNKE